MRIVSQNREYFNINLQTQTIFPVFPFSFFFYKKRSFNATHSELLADYFLVNSKKDDSVMFFSLYKDGDQIKYDRSDRFDLLHPNKLTDERVRLYEKRLDKAFVGE